MVQNPQQETRPEARSLACTEKSVSRILEHDEVASVRLIVLLRKVSRHPDIPQSITGYGSQAFADQLTPRQSFLAVPPGYLIQEAGIQGFTANRLPSPARAVLRESP